MAKLLDSGMTRSKILDTAKQCVCGDREEDYGSPSDEKGL